uniref:Uncharacterized protein n=1 Tax=viral metagenome TaxID=1070528 RepID=A0A6C0HH85_9ZZZZ
MSQEQKQEQQQQKQKIEATKLADLKKELEDKGTTAVKNLWNDNTVTLDKLSNVMEQGHIEFVEKTGRPMTYSEMRELYG